MTAGAAGGKGFRLILHPRMEGRMDMAIDEALAEAVGSGASVPVARLYGFSPATLSLGRFQRFASVARMDRLAAEGVTLVRRPTGGHAVLHDDELTYSVALPKAPGMGTAVVGGGPGEGMDAVPAVGARKREVYEFIARTLLAGLAELGLAGMINSTRTGDLHNPDCFSSAGEYEITAGGKKLIGSAQMTTRTAVLQHGSIPLSNPGHRVMRYLRLDQPVQTTQPTCLNEQAGRILSFDEVRDAFCRAFMRELGARLSELTAGEKEAAERIKAEKYASDAWNLRL